MEPQTLATYTHKLLDERGEPRVLDVERSIQVHKPTLTGSDSPASYYIRPPDGMSVDDFIHWFEAAPGFPDFKLTLVSIAGVDTFHQPLISADDFANKYFHDNQARIVRVVGKSNQAIATMVTFVEALKHPFDASTFPHHSDFAISGYRPPEEGRSTAVKLLYTPANFNQLIKVERAVSVHLDECNLGREIGTSRHATRDQAPELILSSTSNASAGVAFLDALVYSLPRATPEEISEATDAARRSDAQSVVAHTGMPKFARAEAPSLAPTGNELKEAAIARLAEYMIGGRFADGLEVKVTQAGMAIEVAFPRSAATLWLGSTFNDAKHGGELAAKCILVRSDPLLREGWSAIYKFESGALQIRVIDPGSEPPGGWKVVPK